MKQFTGILNLYPLKEKECLQTTPVILSHVTSGHWWIGSISHRSRDGYWAIDIPGEEQSLATEEYILNVLKVTNGEGTFLVESKWWSRIMDSVGSEVIFSKKPLPFRTGVYNKECVNCGSDFVAAKQQGICEECCRQLSTASVLTRPHNKAPKPIRVARFTPSQVEIVEEYIQGGGEPGAFEQWLIDKYGGNSIKR